MTTQAGSLSDKNAWLHRLASSVCSGQSQSFPDSCIPAQPIFCHAAEGDTLPPPLSPKDMPVIFH